jgi:hypothetical protein
MGSKDTKRTKIVGGTIIAFRDGAHRILARLRPQKFFLAGMSPVSTWLSAHSYQP